MKQKNRHGQTLTLRLQHENGEQAQPGLYLSGLLRTQSLEDWQTNPEGFRDWIARSMGRYFQRLEVVIKTQVTI